MSLWFCVIVLVCANVFVCLRVCVFAFVVCLGVRVFVCLCACVFACLCGRVCVCMFGFACLCALYLRALFVFLGVFFV